MGNLRLFKLLSVALLEPLNNAYFMEKSTKSEESLFWPSIWLFSQNLAEPILFAHGCVKQLPS